MPAILDRLVKQLRAKGFNKNSAYAIATKQLQKKGTQKATAKGVAQGKKTPAQRAKIRAAKESKGNKPSDYKYTASTNRATLKRKV